MTRGRGVFVMCQHTAKDFSDGHMIALEGTVTPEA
jgi:hypothetical protein